MKVIADDMAHEYLRTHKMEDAVSLLAEKYPLFEEIMLKAMWQAIDSFVDLTNIDVKNI